jgi:hypothetical protein
VPCGVRSGSHRVPEGCPAASLSDDPLEALAPSTGPSDLLGRRSQTLLRCRRRDSNPHTTRHRNLNPACLPIPPLRHRDSKGSSLSEAAGQPSGTRWLPEYARQHQPRRRTWERLSASTPRLTTPPRSYTCFGQFESVLGKGWGVVSRNIHGDCSAWHRKLVGGGMLRG